MSSIHPYGSSLQGKENEQPSWITPAFFSPALTLRLPGAWVDPTMPYQDRRFPLTQETSTILKPDPPTEDRHHMQQLKTTIATLREQAQQLEETDLVVKKSIQIVSKKRIKAIHQRRQQSQWDWCDDQEENLSGPASLDLPGLDPSEPDDWSDWEVIEQE
ncbi:hypothetical protein DM01DRAFT_1340562 [Hesseltinella vesiculosa]|uniref:Uncharacterized protein n=1 Tax=Hesseltinella vesiculosa TaxID=101127 RepID=A0A1X2G3N3_9FUNG|nr:hypothetical protein DM01DRAFT_1340562 [Hesseltinella vesiculosa]